MKKSLLLLSSQVHFTSFLLCFWRVRQGAAFLHKCGPKCRGADGETESQSGAASIKCTISPSFQANRLPPSNPVLRRTPTTNFMSAGSASVISASEWICSHIPEKQTPKTQWLRGSKFPLLGCSWLWHGTNSVVRCDSHFVAW